MSAPALQQLKVIPIFADLPLEALQALSELATPAEVQPGHVLVEPGYAGSGVFLIESGRVEVDVETGRRIELGPGAFFGELSLLTERPRTARVRALTEVKLLAIGRHDFLHLLQSQPTIALAMLRTLAERLADAQDAV